MTSSQFKLNGLAMHQQWFDNNQNFLFLEARGVMRELLAMCRERTAERDEARRMVCRSQFTMTELQHDYAKDKGWDCFKDER